MSKKCALEEYPEVLNPGDLKQILNVGEKAVYKLLRDNVIHSKKIGRKYKIPKKFLLDYLLN